MNQNQCYLLVSELLILAEQLNDEIGIEDWQFVQGRDLLQGFIEAYVISWDAKNRLAHMPGEPEPRPYENVYKLASEIFYRMANAS